MLRQTTQKRSPLFRPARACFALTGEANALSFVNARGIFTYNSDLFDGATKRNRAVDPCILLQADQNIAFNMAPRSPLLGPPNPAAKPIARPARKKLKKSLNRAPNSNCTPQPPSPPHCEIPPG